MISPSPTWTRSDMAPRPGPGGDWSRPLAFAADLGPDLVRLGVRGAAARRRTPARVSSFGRIDHSRTRPGPSTTISAGSRRSQYPLDRSAGAVGPERGPRRRAPARPRRIVSASTSPRRSASTHFRTRSRRDVGPGRARAWPRTSFIRPTRPRRRRGVVTGTAAPATTTPGVRPRPRQRFPAKSRQQYRQERVRMPVSDRTTHPGRRPPRPSSRPKRSRCHPIQGVGPAGPRQGRRQGDRARRSARRATRAQGRGRSPRACLDPPQPHQAEHECPSSWRTGARSEQGSSTAVQGGRVQPAPASSGPASSSGCTAANSSEQQQAGVDAGEGGADPCRRARNGADVVHLAVREGDRRKIAARARRSPEHGRRDRGGYRPCAISCAARLRPAAAAAPRPTAAATPRVPAHLDGERSDVEQHAASTATMRGWPAPPPTASTSDAVRAGAAQGAVGFHQRRGPAAACAPTGAPLGVAAVRASSASSSVPTSSRRAASMPRK